MFHKHLLFSLLFIYVLGVYNKICCNVDSTPFNVQDGVKDGHQEGKQNPNSHMFAGFLP